MNLSSPRTAFPFAWLALAALPWAGGLAFAQSESRPALRQAFLSALQNRDYQAADTAFERLIGHLPGESSLEPAAADLMLGREVTGRLHRFWTAARATLAKKPAGTSLKLRDRAARFSRLDAATGLMVLEADGATITAEITQLAGGVAAEFARTSLLSEPTTGAASPPDQAAAIDARLTLLVFHLVDGQGDRKQAEQLINEIRKAGGIIPAWVTTLVQSILAFQTPDKPTTVEPTQQRLVAQLTQSAVPAPANRPTAAAAPEAASLDLQGRLPRAFEAAALRLAADPENYHLAWVVHSSPTLEPQRAAAADLVTAMFLHLERTGRVAANLEMSVTRYDVAPQLLTPPTSQVSVLRDAFRRAGTGGRLGDQLAEAILFATSSQTGDPTRKLRKVVILVTDQPGVDPDKISVVANIIQRRNVELLVLGPAAQPATLTPLRLLTLRTSGQYFGY